MIYAENGKEQDSFIAFIECALGILAKEDYTSFLSLFNSSQMTVEGLTLALRYLDETRPVLKIDDPVQVKSGTRNIYLTALKDGSGYLSLIHI